ncbi:MAG: glycoside hydrolase family 3 N-terminal domain-containing protein [Firmicutes bacterium]|nr:glycoside hydrolase family 3 N-terminal domain-containing protein [Bacillota bacterium]
MSDFSPSRLQTSAVGDNSSDSDAVVSPSEIAEMKLKQRVADIVADMSIEEKVGQMFVLRADDSTEFCSILSQTKAGGVLLFARDFKNKSRDDVIAMVGRMQSAADGRLLMAVDEEGGTVVRVSSNPNLRSTKFKSPQDLYAAGGFDLIKADTVEKCTLLKSLGINMNFAPVADVCTDPKGFMYKRSFGKDAEQTAEFVTLVVDTMRQNDVMCCVKHFPGYGNSVADTHDGLDVNTKTLQELNDSDLIPFRRAIAHDVDSIMLTHTIINAIDSEAPASLSEKVVKMIRDEMGFDGVLISDAMDMGAIQKFSGNSGKACVSAVKAGVDLICSPENPVSDYNSVLNAVKSGEIPESQIDEAAARIIKMKIQSGIYA